MLNLDTMRLSSMRSCFEFPFDFLQYQETPLHCACWRGHVEVVSELLAAGAHIESRDSVGWNL
jgi:ankyrin repeat protein